MFSVTTRSGSTLDANAPAGDVGSMAPAFVTEQSVTSFAAMTAVVQMVWQAFENAAGGWADSVWLALGISVLVGLGLSAPILNDRDRPLGDWIRAAVFAVLNVVVLWAAALGINTQLG
ncbi:MAG TPA: hypothetical protein VH760_08970 [Gaiellaceae bacterium]|jgi:hypothetical protein